MSGAGNKSIGQYQVIEFVARGDSAVVYKGYQPAMNRYVAIKMLSPSLARDGEAVRTFQRQAEIMARLDHPGILSVYDYGLEQNLPYLISRLVEGGTLKSRLDILRAPQNALEILSPIVSALEYIHEQGLVHGNLKPTNILFDTQDKPQLTDIGMDQTDKSGQVYLSPEAAQGGPVDRRADVYALGVLLYEMMIGQPPHVGVAPKPRQARPDLPTSIESVILKAMSQYPEERYQTTSEFQEALTVALQVDVALTLSQPERESSIPEPLVYPLPETEPQKDNRWILIAGTILLLVLMCWAAVAVAAFMLTRSSDGTPQSTTGIPQVTANAYQTVYGGPGTQFVIEGALLAGETAQVLGVSADGQWWNILFPRATNGTGWVAADLVTAENVDSVPVVEPEATPVAFLTIRSKTNE